jgi:hypothetical protein
MRRRHSRDLRPCHLPTTAPRCCVWLCLQLLNRAQQAHHLAAAATARYPNHPFRLLQTADLAWYCHDHWPALLAYLNALQQQPRLHNLWTRILKIASALTAAPPPGVDAAPHQAQLRQLLIALAEQLPVQPTPPQQLTRLAHLLPLLPANPAQAQDELARHCRHALAALEALDTLEPAP